MIQVNQTTGTNNACCGISEDFGTSMDDSPLIERRGEDMPTSIHRYERVYMSYLHLQFCFLDFKETMFISVTDERNQLTDLQASYPLKYVDADNTACLVGEPHSHGNDVARLLGMKFKIPFYVSVNVDEGDEKLTNFIFSTCLEILKPLFNEKRGAPGLHCGSDSTQT
ncbi:conserved Plasmodium protein, unknown function [Plasmodium knowlesi strain H]|uniref:Proteasome assembly chaperone 4 n=3 Tax=Plasmodium knowlesi TaxID=5850 RepID=A0A5K1VGH4_PLAKH|nr:proteasome assembly chaperone 4, putative [Plasmodium knowlesi strain H]OTN68525.1 Uncharacterized protein PKNOH_S02311400 [Plasmodium knowlesi]CAA9986615.1 proteasome assembly chaperone 4, putative [Plasmodium knowlesi strain H]SBO24107.1 conserved Plasmodium protein, unknown function [Plasmodium knowlesi strain H]SBO29326.1 conserved Plasmodium protein, unknown function [Plasmodium knowlesi strain H]VVS76089.1 proteasome assembly chaperone 4, putative [Plasmodium knowlesi strain H]|eukprot:XP_002261155.1 hypothetical protein, conserved in Plasmodium species [Plasmodium knowlesi strain H]